jgi:Cft2 family RNA processing exonuclease
MSEATKQLLVADFDADLDIRENIKALDLGMRHKIGRDYVTLVSSGHMLGGVQVAVDLPNGIALGYSGDFQWPLEAVIKADALVVDSTYGSAVSVRKFSQAEAEERFLELVASKLKRGPVHIKAHRGTIERALQIISGNVNYPLVCSPRLCSEVAVYRKFAYGIESVMPIDSREGGRIIERQKYIRFYGKGDGCPVEIASGSMIVLSAYMVGGENPVLQYSDRSFRVALSNHADFFGTLEYIRATGAKYVVTDNTRGHGVELAREIKARLGIEARPSTSEVSYEWGV